MDILKEHIVVLEKDQLTTHQSELTTFFMKALDFRTEHSQVIYGRSLWSKYGCTSSLYVVPNCFQVLYLKMLTKLLHMGCLDLVN